MNLQKEPMESRPIGLLEGILYGQQPKELNSEEQMVLVKM